ncbi:MAG: AAA family ATPase [Arcobacteraceae bacterium]
MQIIKEIKISYFRSFSKQIHIHNISDLNILSGKNDSGKSNVLKALNLFFTEDKVDFYSDFNFNNDFSKYRANQSKTLHNKQLINISILFSKNGFYSSKVLPDEFWIEKTWNKDGKFHDRKTKTKRGALLKYIREGEEKESDAEVKSSTTSFLKKIYFLYIPAIKDFRFFDYLKQEYQQSLGTKMSKLGTDLSSTSTQQKTLREWMEQLTAGDITNLLSQKIDLEAERMMKHFLGNAQEIDTSNFAIPELDFSKVLEVVTENEIPLTSRGDGIQAKFIPQILNEITRNKKANIVIWAFEEPENSYEYANAQLLANKFKDEYSQDKQIFLTSHAFNFISLEGENVSLYRIWRENFEQGTQVMLIDNKGKLFEDQSSEILKEELGVIQLNKELEKFFKDKEAQRIEELEKYQNHVAELQTKMSSIIKPLVITEGKTDWKHLKKAQSSLKINLDINYLEYSEDMGSSVLAKMIDEFKKVSHSNKIIFIFDRDESHYVSKYGKHEFNSHGNNIYSFCIPAVNSTLNHIPIEYYYKDDALKAKDENGRRLFLGKEFYTSGNSICGQYQTQKKDKCEKQVVIDEKVFASTDSKHECSIALSKNNFAKNIFNANKNFDNIDFDNFQLIFKIINKINEEI